MKIDERARERLSALLIRVKGDRTVRQFARDLGVSLGAVQNWLDRSTFPNPKNLARIAEKAGMEIQEIYEELNGEEKTPPEPKSPRDVFQVATRHLDDEGLRELIILLVQAIGRD